MNKEKLIKLLKTTQITSKDIEVLKNSPVLFYHLINIKHQNIKSNKNLSGNKKFFVLYGEKLYCIDVKLDDDNISYELIGDIYEIVPETLDCSNKKLEVNFCAQGICLTGDIISLETFNAEQSQDGILVNTISNEFIMNANDMVSELDLPRKRYTYYKDLDNDAKERKI